MNHPSLAVDPRPVPFMALVPFLFMTFGVTWGIFALFILWPDWIVATFGELSGRHPLFILAVWSPAIAAFMIVTYTSGWDGLRRYLSRLLLWRCSLAWYGFLILGIPLLFFGGAVLKGNFLAESLPFSSVQSLLLALGMTLAVGPVEEFGWRGLALPLLQRRFTPFWAGLILGVIWSVWHLPAFLLSGTPQSAWSFTPFFVASTALGVLVTPLFNASRGSILLPVLFHFQCNNPIWPDAQPYDTFTFGAAAVLVVWLNRKQMFSRKDAVTVVIPSSRRQGMPEAPG